MKNLMTTSSSSPLPDEVFNVVAVLFPHLVRICEDDCGLVPIELFALWYVRHYGMRDAMGRAVFLRHEFTEVFKKQFHYSDQGVSNITGRLHEKNLLLTTKLNHDELQQLYGRGAGRTSVVILTGDGEAKVAEFKGRLKPLVEDILQNMPMMLRKPLKTFLPWTAKIGAWMVKSVDWKEKAPTGVEGPTMLAAQ